MLRKSSGWPHVPLINTSRSCSICVFSPIFVKYLTVNRVAFLSSHALTHYCHSGEIRLVLEISPLIPDRVGWQLPSPLCVAMSLAVWMLSVGTPSISLPLSLARSPPLTWDRLGISSGTIWNLEIAEYYLSSMNMKTDYHIWSCNRTKSFVVPRATCSSGACCKL